MTFGLLLQWHARAYLATLQLARAAGIPEAELVGAVVGFVREAGAVLERKPD